MRMDLLINTYGTRIRSTGQRIVLEVPGKKQSEQYPIRSLEKIIILRPSSISTHAVQLALEFGVDIVYLNSFGTPVGRIFSSIPKGLAELRRSQLKISNSTHAFSIAKALVKGKSLNQLTYIKSLDTKLPKKFTTEIIQSETILQSLTFMQDGPHAREQLFGFEGFIADKYFKCLKKLFKFPGRKPQGRDKFNSTINYGYGILYNEVEKACLYVGLDPYLGLYHSERYGKPALVLDLVEEFRVSVVDSVIIPLFLTKKLGTKDFIRIKPGEYQLSMEGKRKVVENIFTRLHEDHSWHDKHYAMQDIITHQVRALAQYFLGKKPEYEPFIYREF